MKTIWRGRPHKQIYNGIKDHTKETIGADGYKKDTIGADGHFPVKAASPKKTINREEKEIPCFRAKTTRARSRRLTPQSSQVNSA